MTVKAYVLVVTDPGKTKKVVQAIRDVPGIVEMHEVMGPYDIIVEIEVQNLQEIPPSWARRSARSRGSRVRRPW